MIAEHVQRNIYILKDVSHLQKWFTAKGDILVLDDLMAEGGYDREVMDLFTKHSHHRNITVLYLFQDMFPPCKYAKTISRNSHYIVAFKNPRDQLSMHNIISQAYPKTWEQVMEVYRKETERLFGYLTVDFHPASHDRFRIVSRLLKHEGCMRYFILPSHNLTSIKVTPYEKEKRRATCCAERWICSGGNGCTGYESFGDFGRHQKARKEGSCCLRSLCFEKRSEEVTVKEAKEGKK